MTDRVFCIDLGSGYTKVGLRTAPTESAILLTSPTVAAGGVEFCIPSVVAVDTQGGGRKYEYGYDALNRRAGGQIQVFTNWKRWVFEAGRTLPMGLEPLLASEDFAALAGRFQVPLQQVRSLQHLVRAARGLGGATPLATEPREVQLAKVIAEKFFGFLRTFTLDVCRRLARPPEGVEDIPAVLAVPAFGPEDELGVNPGVQLLTSAMTKAGWKLRTPRPVISEPLSNAVGVLTDGENAMRTVVYKNKPKVRRLDLGKMFRKGPIITATKSPKHHPLYRAVVVDVGAYTTDIAVVEVPVSQIDDFEPAAFSCRQVSVPLGMHTLDARVRSVLPTAQADYLSRLSAADEEDFRRRVYAEGVQYRTLEGAIGGSAARPAINDVLNTFANEITDHLTGFCRGWPPSNLQELLLTGGGNNIPALRSAFETAIGTLGGAVQVHTSGERAAVLTCPHRQLTNPTSRGGSALGGCSIFFEPAYW